MIAAPVHAGALPLLDEVLKEGLRLMPPAPLNARYASEDTTVGGPWRVRQ